jgi:prolyl oligopeptidase
MAEYGDPDTDDWLFLRKHSPYHLLRHDCLGLPEAGGAPKDRCATWRCPKVLFTTSTRDDRVHPGHARKMVRALQVVE